MKESIHPTGSISEESSFSRGSEGQHCHDSELFAGMSDERFA